MSYNKEAILICLDVGPSMRLESKGAPAAFNAAVECVKWILKRRIFTESSDEVALLLFGSDASRNPYFELGRTEYKNICLASELKTVDWDLFESVCRLADSKCGTDVDFRRALAVAASYLVQATQAKRFGQRSVVLLSCFAVHVAGLDSTLVETLTEGNLELAVIGPDDSDSSSRNIEIVQRLVSSVSGIYCPFNQATSLLGLYQRRSIKAVAWKCDLEVGTHLQIPVCSYVKCRSYHLKQGWKYANVRCPYVDVTMERTYHSVSMADDENSEQKPANKWLGEEVYERDLVKAFRYGASVVPLSKLDQEATKYRSEKKGLQILGFVSRDEVKFWHFTGNGSHFLFADAGNRYACQVLSAMIRACHSLGKLALVRYVYSVSSIPRLCVLIPIVKSSYECFALLNVPYAEDVVKTAHRSLTKQKSLTPNADQLDAVDSLITAMDLTRLNQDGEDAPFKWSNISDPHFQYFFSCMEHRALDPDEKLLPVEDRFLAPVSPSEEIMKRSKPCLDLLKERFCLEHLGRKKLKRAAAEIFKSEEGVTPLQQIAAEHKDEVPFKVGTVDPVNDFRQMVKCGRSFLEACEQFVEVILHLMFESHDNFFLRKVAHCATVLRSSCIQESAPNVYNRFLARVKHEALGNAEKVVWVSSLLADQLGPISSTECSCSELSADDAANFFEQIGATNAPVKSEQLSAISADLINELE
uniref:Ku domain-containing protein n=1 Tax=Trichuris muris TaxID=70415 RepID=A0A5S6R1N4_TRIMR